MLEFENKKLPWSIVIFVLAKHTISMHGLPIWSRPICIPPALLKLYKKSDYKLKCRFCCFVGSLALVTAQPASYQAV